MSGDEQVGDVRRRSVSLPKTAAAAAMVLVVAAAMFTAGWAVGRGDGEAAPERTDALPSTPAEVPGGSDDSDGEVLELEGASAEAEVSSLPVKASEGASAGLDAETYEGTVVVYRDGEFVPGKVQVAVGATVTFVNRSEQGMWPASNIHPTHEIYPEFDPLQTIWPGESWSHKFDREGTWRYHNHVGPDEIGVVTVTGSGAAGKVPPLTAVFADLSWPEPPQGTATSLGLADEPTLLDFVADYGPAATMRLLQELENSGTGYECHQPAHAVGRRAYELWGPSVITLSVHECRSGVLHGAMEALFAERGTARLQEDILALCAPIDNAFKKYNCYHGLGHGLMAWTSYEIHEALELCDLAPDDWEASSCWSGVFMENIVGGLSALMGHTSAYVAADDPVKPCDVVAPRYAATCYNFQTSHMLAVLDGDYAAAAALCLAAPKGTPDGAEWHYDAQWQCFSSLGRDISSHQDWRPAADLELCGHAPAGRLRSACATGAAQNRFWDASGAVIAAAYCNVHADNIDSRGGEDTADECYMTILDRAAQILEDDGQRAGFCAGLDAPWTGRCAERFSVTVPDASVPAGAQPPAR